MKVDTSLRTVEPLEMVKKHPAAATFGGVMTAIICGLMGVMGGSPTVGLLMAAVGAIIGAPGAAHIADSAAPERPV